jgi:3-phenylpropionate/cinnamic acid dioxygenase small subunit
MTTLSTEDRSTLHDVYARYAHAFDGADADAWAALFAADARFIPPGVDPVVGREALRRFVADRAEDAPGMRHLIANVVVEPTEDGARGRAYFFCLRLSDDGQFRLRNFGRYEDEFVREDGGWKIASRTVVSELATALVDAPFAFGGAQVA